MKIAISHLVIKEKKFAEAVEYAKQCGYEGLEPRIGEDEDLHINASDDELRQFRQIADEAGIELTSTVCGVRDRGAFGSPDQAERRRGREIVARQLEISAAMGIDTALVIPCRVAEGVSYEECYHYTVQGAKLLAPVAERLKVNLAIEIVWNKFLLSPLETRRLIDEVGSEYVGIFFDVGNVVIHGFPEQWIQILGSRIKKVHFKDFRRKDYQFVGLKEGDVNWRLVMDALRGANYDDFVISEVSPKLCDPAETAKRMKEIINL